MALPAWGCSFVADERPLAERLKEVPVAFIGTVSRVTPDGTVEFQIEHLLRGKVAGHLFVVRTTPSTCNLMFAMGQRWLYGGDMVIHPSVRLAAPGQTVAGAASLARADDSKLAFPPLWQACDADVQCSVLPYGCTSTAVNKRFLPAATEQAARVAGGARAVNCTAPLTPAFEQALCEKNRCGLWRLQESH